MIFERTAKQGAGAVITVSNHVQGFHPLQLYWVARTVPNKIVLASKLFVRREGSKTLCKSWPAKQRAHAQPRLDFEFLLVSERSEYLESGKLFDSNNVCYPPASQKVKCLYITLAGSSSTGTLLCSPL